MPRATAKGRFRPAFGSAVRPLLFGVARGVVFFALACALMGSRGLRPTGPAFAAQQHSPPQDLVAVVPANMPPLYFLGPGGVPTGFAVEVMRQVATRAGYHLRIITASSGEEAQALLAEGSAQVLPGLGISDERKQFVLFTQPIETQPVHIYFRANGPARETLASLEGRRVSLLAGSIPMERLRNQPGITLSAAQSLPQALFDLISGESDALVFQHPFVESAAQTAGLAGKLARSRAPLFEVSRGIAIVQDRPDILQRLDETLSRYRETPEFHSLYLAWHAEPEPPLLPMAARWLMGGLLLGLAGALMLWRYVSVLRVNRKLLSALSARDQALAELRLTQERMEALSTLSHMSSQSNDSLITFALDEGVRLTGSAMGFLLFLEDGKVDLAKVRWALGGNNAPTLPPAPVYPITEAGLWAQCLHTGEPTVVNDYGSHPDRRTLPEGHTPLVRFMAVPLLEEGRPMAVFCVSNKNTPYDDNDSRQLQLFLAGLWRVLASRRDAQSLRQSKDYAESLVEGANAMLVGLDTEGRTTLFNAAAEAISGFARAEVLGRDWNATMQPAPIAASSTATYRDFMAGRTALPRQLESTLRTKDGRLRHISWQNSLLKQGDRVTGILSYGIDITEQKQAEAELRRLHRAIGQAAEGVLIADGEGTILYANPAFGRMTGLPRGTGKTLSVFDLDISVLDHHSSSIQSEAQEGAWRGTCVFAKPGAAPAEVEFTVTSMRSRADRQISFVAVCREVTEKRLLEHQLWQAQKMEALGTLAGGIAHDFNNLLASIMGFTELALDDTPHDSRARACLERVLGASLRARELVRQILSFSRRSEHKLRLLQADTAIAEALKLLEASVSKSIEMRVELRAGSSILADPSQIHQIVMNLCTNAAQAMQHEGGRLTVRSTAQPLPVELAARHRLPPGEYLTLCVEDQGPGIAPELLARIFDPFFTTKAPGEGTGLGLAVVHGIVTSLGGTVWAESEPGHGARFTILLPTQTSGEETPRTPSPGDLRGRERILFVDDESDILELGQKALAPLGYNVVTEHSPEAALRLLLAQPQAFDLLITDMNMPRLSGVQLAESLRPVLLDLPIVFITGFSKDLPPDHLESLGVVRVLPKPFSMGELAQAVRQALAHNSKGEP